jgi:hypothetical protein
MKMQMLWCIICKFEQTYGDVLMQIFTFYKGLIKYNKVNGMIPINIHVQTTHLKLFGQKKQFMEKVAEPTTHRQWPNKKKNVSI